MHPHAYTFKSRKVPFKHFLQTSAFLLFIVIRLRIKRNMNQNQVIINN